MSVEALEPGTDGAFVASVRAVAPPMPWFAPVTSATWPERSKGGGALGDMAQTLVRRVGVEPTTDGLKARCSTTELTPLSEGTYSDAACERRGCDEGSVCAYLQGLNGHDGSSVEWPVDVREELRTPFEVLVMDLGVHSFRRDRQHDKIRASAEDGVRDGQYLLRSGAVDEAF